MSFADDLEVEASKPRMNITAVWLDGQSEEVQREFMSWLKAGRSRAALFRVSQKHGLDRHLNSVSTFREHCRTIVEDGIFDS